MKTLLRTDSNLLEKIEKLAWVTFTRESQPNPMNNNGTAAVNQAAETID